MLTASGKMCKWYLCLVSEGTDCRDFSLFRLFIIENRFVFKSKAGEKEMRNQQGCNYQLGRTDGIQEGFILEAFCVLLED